MGEKIIKIVKGIGIATIYLIALFFTYFLGHYLLSKPTVAFRNDLLCIYFHLNWLSFFFLAVTLCPVGFSFVKKRWAKPLRFINALNLILLICILIFAQPYTTAAEMEENYLEHKDDMEKLVRYVNASAKHNTELVYKLKEIDSWNCKEKGTIKQLMEKANVKEIKITTRPDTCTIDADLVYKYFGKSSRYFYVIIINAKILNKDVTYPHKGAPYLNYNDSVAITYDDSFFSCPKFLDYSEFVKKLQARRNKQIFSGQ